MTKKIWIKIRWKERTLKNIKVKKIRKKEKLSMKMNKNVMKNQERGNMKKN